MGKDDAALETQDRRVLEHLGKQHGLPRLVLRKGQTKLQDPAKLNRLISDLLDRENWMVLSAATKGEAQEGLLDADTLADPDLITAEIVDDLRSALEQMEALLAEA